MQAPARLTRHLHMIWVAALLASCGGGGAGQPNAPGPAASAPTPTPSPAPTPTPAPSFVGAVYAGTNNFGPAGNWVTGFGRLPDGTLVPLDTYETGGIGRGTFSLDPPRLNPLIAEDSIIAVDNRFLLVVNAGSNDVTSFRINGDYSLTQLDLEPSGGTSPVSLAYGGGVVYVANADEDGTFTGPIDQSGNITAMRLDPSTGHLTRIAGFSLSLRARPADLEVTADGDYLVVSAFNAGAPGLPQPAAAEVSTFRIQPDGTLENTPSGTGMSTQPNDGAGRNLPSATGIEVFARGSRQFLIAAEARKITSGGTLATFATMQTGSVSTWEIDANGSLVPRSQDFLLGSSITSGPTDTGFVAYNVGYGFAAIASSAGAAITSIAFDEHGMVTLVANDGYQLRGMAADPTAANPLANGDGYVDLVFDPTDNFLYQLVGLRGRIDTYAIVFSYERQQQLTTGLLPPDNLQGLVVIGTEVPCC